MIGIVRLSGRVALGDRTAIVNTVNGCGPGCDGPYGGFEKRTILWGLGLDEDVRFKVTSRLGYMKVRRARGTAGERWTDDSLAGRFRLGAHGSRRWCCKDVKVWRVGYGSKHRTKRRGEGRVDEGEQCN